MNRFMSTVALLALSTTMMCGVAQAASAETEFKLPQPTATTLVPRPTGTRADLKVLPWAGFHSAVSYTFDDSSPSQIENWPKIKAEHVRSTFYIVPNAQGESGYEATFKDIVALGNELGNHTWHHCRAAQLGGADLKGCPDGFSIDEELDKTSAYIKSLGQPDVWTMAYPFGDTGYIDAVKPRFLLARGVFPGLVGADDNTNPYILPIVAHAGDPNPPGGDDVAVFNADLDRAQAEGKWLVFLFHTLLPTSSNWGAGENVAAVTGSMEYAKSHDMWIDSVVNIGSYWIGERLVDNAAKTQSGDVTTWSWTLPPHFPAGRVLRVTVDGGELSQGGKALAWDPHGYYEVSLDAGSLSWKK
ncbi:MAG TPA: polysaccharide deacetylase family protein [Asticcacaulis sp.]|nr:polysaccharide deacetylase family protein [Asticcacaulis sp.]